MKMPSIKLSAITVMLIFFVQFHGTYAENKPEIKHITTIKVGYITNWYSYNFAICATEKVIESPKILVISDIETKTVYTEKNIHPGNCISFGTMIHAIEPNAIITEFV